MTRMFSTPEEIAEYDRRREAEDAERAEREAQVQAEHEMTAQNILAGVLAMPRDRAQRLFRMPMESHDSSRHISSSTVHAEYDLGLPYVGPLNVTAPSTFLVVERTLSSHSDDGKTEYPAGVDRLSVYLPDSSDDWRLPVMYGLRAYRVASFKFDREAGTVSAELPRVRGDVAVSQSPLAFEAVNDLVAELDGAPQRVVTDLTDLPRARAI